MLATPNDTTLSDMQLRELMPEIAEPTPRKLTSSIAVHRAESEIELIRRVLDESDGSYAKASERLGISRTTLWRKLKKDRAV
jgi:propionate catabolism operon transcriptional regulator